MDPAPLVDIHNLFLYYSSRSGPVQAVDDLSLPIFPGRAVGVLGESGCGKSSIPKAILRLLPSNVARYEGRIWMDGLDIMGLGEEQFRRQVRWVKISLVAQAAMNALNPVARIGRQVEEALLAHGLTSKRQAGERIRQVFAHVDLPEDVIQRYPFQLSGGMRQRAVIAMALVAEPRLVILDEPTSALDLLTQANIMNVLKRIKRDRKTSFMFITHDVGTCSELADTVAVMYAGQLVELAEAASFFRHPLHPYSHKLMASVPRLYGDQELEPIPGRPPSLIDPPAGCRFRTRCDQSFSRCTQTPPLLTTREGGRARCWLYETEAVQT
ncbi:MAG: ABC transporter ATP-binding protein [Desulfovermiculus sp.]|nr:ABC transporter ATP-binding protein [Desulfovermiculus sp.]